MNPNFFGFWVVGSWYFLCLFLLVFFSSGIFHGNQREGRKWRISSGCQVAQIPLLWIRMCSCKEEDVGNYVTTGAPAGSLLMNTVLASHACLRRGCNSCPSLSNSNARVLNVGQNQEFEQSGRGYQYSVYCRIGAKRNWPLQIIQILFPSSGDRHKSALEVDWWDRRGKWPTVSQLHPPPTGLIIQMQGGFDESIWNGGRCLGERDE